MAAPLRDGMASHRLRVMGNAGYGAAMLFYIAGAVIYALGFFLVATALGADLIDKPRMVTTTVVLWPVVLPLGAMAGLIGFATGFRQPLLIIGNLDMASRRLHCRVTGHTPAPNTFYIVDGARRLYCRRCGDPYG